MKLSNIFDKYADLIEKSLNGEEPISEDTIRYLFYACVISNYNLKEKELLKIQQELPYFSKKLGLNNNEINQLNNNVELDSFYEFGKEEYAIEFKYHRSLSNKGKINSLAKTRCAGEVFDDINRLSLIRNNINKYFIYLMDENMVNYEKKTGRFFKKVFGENKEGTIKQEEIKKQAPKFIKEAFSSFIKKENSKLKDIKFKQVFSRNFNIKKDHNKEFRIVILKIN